MKPTVILSWVLQLVVAVILGQTLFFKFSGAEESVELFTALGLEPYGRIGIGILELITVVLVLIPRTVPYGAILALGTMSGALFSHLIKLGFAGDLGVLAVMAAVAGIASATLILLHRERLPVLKGLFAEDK